MTAATDTLTIPSWANGPDGSGNGGWSAGLLAPWVRDGGHGVAVSLRVPPPLDRALRVSTDAEGASLLDDAAGDEPLLVASAHSELVDVTVPDIARSITFEQARAAQAGFPFRDEHPFPRCIACGVAREPGTPSLQLHAGSVPGHEVTDAAGAAVPIFATTWIPEATVADDAEPTRVRVEACWSALDCPSAAPFADPHAEHPSVLARIAARIDAPVHVGKPYVVVAWQRAIDGRKQYSCSAILDETGRVLAVADALWIQVRPR